MQTFLPYAEFDRSAQVLDVRRLGKQRVEALQVLRGLLVEGYGWRHHPAVRMWRGHPEALGCYGVTMALRWVSLGYADTVEASLRRELAEVGIDTIRSQGELQEVGGLPPWLGDTELHRSHQSNLVRKDPTWYRQFFPTVAADLPYVWPADPSVEAEERA